MLLLQKTSECLFYLPTLFAVARGAALNRRFTVSSADLVLVSRPLLTGRAPTCLPRQVLNEIAQHKIKIYEFPDVDDEEQRKEQRGLRDRVPFAVVGSNTVVEVDGRKVRGRRYPWGVVEGVTLAFTVPTVDAMIYYGRA